MNSKQHGYYYAPADGFGCFILVVIGLAVAVGIALWELAKWAWPFIRAWLHAATA